MRRKLIDALREPDSAANLARRFDMSRQRIGYHMRELEKAGCIEVTGERPQRGLTERLYQVRPMAFVDGDAAAEPPKRRDRYSWRALVDLLAQSLCKRADAAGKRLATLALATDVRFDDPAGRKAFTEDLLDAVEAVVARHHRPGGKRSFRVALGAYPTLQPGDPT